MSWRVARIVFRDLPSMLRGGLFTPYKRDSLSMGSSMSTSQKDGRHFYIPASTDDWCRMLSGNATLPSKSLMLDLANTGTLHGQDLAEDRKFTRRESPDGVQAVGNCSAISLKGSYDHTDTRECAQTFLHPTSLVNLPTARNYRTHIYRIRRAWKWKYTSTWHFTSRSRWFFSEYVVPCVVQFLWDG